jgi:molybdate transport system substrate-binding protein
VLLAALPPGFLFADDVVTVAVASNFWKTATEISAAFTEESGVSVRISAGSTGKLYAQIINGAPFDVFLSADTERPLLLEQSGLVVSGSRRNYAIGRLILWSRDERLRGKDCRQALQRGDYDWLALANPKTAPYGLAAREVLEAADLWESASQRAVFGENISQTLQFVATENATLGFVALSQTRDSNLPSATCTWTIPATSHAPLDQQAVLLERARSNDGARRFIEYLSTPTAKEIISQNGYWIPDRWTP